MMVLTDALAKLRETAAESSGYTWHWFHRDEAAAVLGLIGHLQDRIDELESKASGATGTVAVAEAGQTVQQDASRTARGFRMYAKMLDRYGAEVSIVESSSATESQLWIQIHAGKRDRANRQDSSALFAVPQARRFAHALLRACEEQGEWDDETVSPASATGDLGSPPSFTSCESKEASLVAAVVEAERERERLRAKISEAECLLGELGAGGTPAGLVPAIHNLQSMREAADKRLEALTEAVDAYSAFDDVIAVLADARREQTRRLDAARVVLAGGTEPPETVEIGDDRDGRRAAEEGPTDA